jgi:RNA-binding protein 39
MQAVAVGTVVPLPGPAGSVSGVTSLGGDLVGELDDGRDAGLAMNASQRALLMQRLSRGQDMSSNSSAGNKAASQTPKETAILSLNAPCMTTTTPTRCLLLSNMFDPVVELKSNPNFDLEVSEDVRDEVSKYGVVQHIFVDKSSRGLVYLVLDNVAASAAAKNALHGRWFGGNMITAEFVDENEYKRRNADAPLQGA